ncbi:MAG: SGNH/GDSL hydrolase family protein [Lachnospira sp.]|nr:SGNH/GDSL hydrolase family protein [Lachnospira sp.]
MNLKGAKINFLGDSITEPYGTSDIDHAYWKLLEKRDGVIARGYGIGGTRIARQQVPMPEEHAKWDRYFLSRVPDMDPDADAVTVFGGTNDYGHGDAAIGHFTDRTDDTFYGALHNLYHALILKYPGKPIVIMTPLHRENEHRDYNELGLRSVACLEEYVDIIQEVAAYYALPVLDLYRTSGMNPNIPELKERYNPDGLHPNDAGHELIYAKLRELLTRL